MKGKKFPTKIPPTQDQYRELKRELADMHRAVLAIRGNIIEDLPKIQKALLELKEMIQIKDKL